MLGAQLRVQHEGHKVAHMLGAQLRAQREGHKVARSQAPRCAFLVPGKATRWVCRVPRLAPPRLSLRLRCVGVSLYS